LRIAKWSRGNVAQVALPLKNPKEKRTIEC
jgi:hypothetical protein